MFFNKNLTGLSITDKFIKVSSIKYNRKNNFIESIKNEKFNSDFLFSVENEFIELTDKEQLIIILKDIFSSKEYGGKRVNLSLSPLCSKNFILYFENIPAKTDEIIKFIKWNLEKKYKFNSDGYKISYQLISETRINNKLMTRLLISCIDNVFFHDIAQTMKKSNLKPYSITLLPFSLFNLYISKGKYSQGFELLLFIFNGYSSLMIIDKGELVFYRIINFENINEFFSDSYDTINYFFDDIENIYGRLHSSQKRWIDRVILYDEEERYDDLKADIKEVFSVREVNYLSEDEDYMFFSDSVSAGYYSINRG